MGLTNAGKKLIAALLAGEAVPALNAANARLGVGDGTLAFAPTQTDLQGASRLRKGMAAGYPQRTGASLVLKASFGPTEANFTWSEWGVFNGPNAAASEDDLANAMLIRVVEPLGTKTSAETWELTVIITVEGT